LIKKIKRVFRVRFFIIFYSFWTTFGSILASFFDDFLKTKSTSFLERLVDVFFEKNTVFLMIFGIVF